MARSKPVMRISGLKSLTSKLHLLKANTPPRGVAALTTGAQRTAKLASMYAPVDEGNLEESIKATKVKKVLGKAEVTIGVDETKAVPNKPGITVGDYAWMMHDGVYDLGPKSEEKQAELNVEVGPKFLTRALRDMRPFILQMLAKVMKPSSVIGRSKKK